MTLRGPCPFVTSEYELASDIFMDINIIIAFCIKKKFVFLKAEFSINNVYVILSFCGPSN